LPRRRKRTELPFGYAYHLDLASISLPELAIVPQGAGVVLVLASVADCTGNVTLIVAGMDGPEKGAIPLKFAAMPRVSISRQGVIAMNVRALLDTWFHGRLFLKLPKENLTYPVTPRPPPAFYNQSHEKRALHPLFTQEKRPHLSHIVFRARSKLPSLPRSRRNFAELRPFGGIQVCIGFRGIIHLATKARYCSVSRSHSEHAMSLGACAGTLADLVATCRKVLGKHHQRSVVPEHIKHPAIIRRWPAHHGHNIAAWNLDGSSLAFDGLDPEDGSVQPKTFAC
jgi:hypothetical protein